MIFNYGDSVKVSDRAPQKYKPGSIGEVVALYEVKETDSEERLGVTAGTILIGIEASDGSYLDVPLEFVCPLNLKPK